MESWWWPGNSVPGMAATALVSDDGECPTSLGDNLIDFLVDIAFQVGCKD